MANIRTLAIVTLLAASGAACAKAQARTPAPAPELTVPAPPSRVVIPVTVRVPEPPPAEPVTAEPARPAAATGTPPSRPPERPPTTTPATTPAPPPVLQTTANPVALEERVRGMVSAARADLAKVDRARLTQNARDQFDTAQRFIRMAEDALTAKNLVYAQQLAESAAAVAGRLVKGEPAAATAP